jgi:EAL domain-containing protein (putative c-di-GMP-specific phosphodiesterase class I)/GGDEF domain-containing protein
MQQEYKILIHTKYPAVLEELERLGSAQGCRYVPLPDISNLVLSVYDEMPHLVLVDLRRANVGGFEICKQLKSDAVLEHIPVIVLTDLTEPAADLPDSGADRVLSRDEPPANIWFHVREIIETSVHALDVNPLTRLPGSRSSVERMEAIIQKEEPFAICAVHLRQLNYYYRTFGPRRGDALVRRTLEIITEIYGRPAQGRGFVGHLGDRDFVVTLPPEKAVEFAERVIEQFDSRLGGVSGTVDEGRTEGVVTLSIAIVTNEKVPFRHIAEVVRTCEQMHRFLKRYPHSAYLKDRRTSVRDLLSPVSFEVGGKRPALQMNVDPSKKRHPASDLLMSVAAAIHSGAVEAHYQPIVDWTGTVRAHEALSRFVSADGKPIDPVRMFQAAREADLIRELDVACAVNVLRSATSLPPKTKLFVNLNRETLLDPQCLEQIWDEGFFDTRRIVIEITEQSLVRQSTQLRQVMEDLGSRGIQLALDDAGGGSVSLREAAELKPHFIKFDKSIIRDIHASDAKRKIVLSLSVFAKSMGASTIAEGIETEAEWSYLKNAGVDWGQGYFIAKPQASPVARVTHLS